VFKINNGTCYCKCLRYLFDENLEVRIYRGKAGWQISGQGGVAGVDDEVGSHGKHDNFVLVRLNMFDGSMVLNLVPGWDTFCLLTVQPTSMSDISLDIGITNNQDTFSSL
jgi:hypothetical protein